MGVDYAEDEDEYDPRDQLNNTTLTFPNSLSTIYSSDKTMSVSMRSKSSRRSDIIPSRPPKRQTASLSAAAIVQRSLVRPLNKNIKGVGYIKPGNPFKNRPRTLSHDFSFDLAAPIGYRACTFTSWRHGFGGYDDIDSDVLSPAISESARTIDGVDLNTAIRNGSPGPLPYLVGVNAGPIGMKSSTSLWDLEVASWNSNSYKPIYDRGNFYTTSNATSKAGPAWTYLDFKPDLDHPNYSPFPAPDYTPTSFLDQQRSPFMVNLGSGSVSFACQNKVPTSAEVEFVVYQIRDVQTTSYGTTTNSATIDQINYSNATCKAHLRGPVLSGQSSGSGGKDYTDYDNLNDPDYKFMAVYPKHSATRPPLVEKDRVKFVLQGGAMKVVKFLLPAQIYDSVKNRVISGNPFATTTSGTPPVTTYTPTTNACFNSLTYIIAVAVNGVVMPVFTYPLTNNTNTATTADHNNISVVDRQSAFASVLFTGTYVEHPLPCLATPELTVYNNKPMLADTSLVEIEDDQGGTLSPTFGFCTGLVASMPVNVASGNTIVFSQIGDTLIKQDTVD